MGKHIMSAVTGLVCSMVLCCAQPVVATEIYQEQHYSTAVDNYSIEVASVEVNTPKMDLQGDDRVAVHYGSKAPEMTGSTAVSLNTAIMMRLLVSCEKIEDMDKFYGISDLEFVDAESGKKYKAEGFSPAGDSVLSPSFPGRRQQALPALSHFLPHGMSLQHKNKHGVDIMGSFSTYMNHRLSVIASLAGNIVLFDTIKEKKISIPSINEVSETKSETEDASFTFKVEKQDNASGKRLKVIIYIKPAKQIAYNPKEQTDRFAVLLDKTGKEIKWAGRSGSTEIETYDFPVPSFQDDLTLEYTILHKSNPTRKLPFEIKNIPVLQPEPEKVKLNR